MKLIARKNKDVFLYQGLYYYVARMTLDSVKYRSDSTHNWLTSEIGKYNRYFLIRDNSDTVKNGYADMIKGISINYKTHRLMIIWKQR